MNQIESGAIPMLTEAFMDQMTNTEDFIAEYGEDAYRWIIYNELSVQYVYTNLIMSIDAHDPAEMENVFT
jgi:hypothetical protein